jgi:hypothetical protein
MRGLKTLAACLVAVMGGVGLIATPAIAQAPVLDHCIFEWDMVAQPGISGFTLYLGTASGGPYSPLGATIPPSATQATEAVHYTTLDRCAGLSEGQKWTVVRAFDGAGQESQNSNEVTFVFSLGTNVAPLVNAGPDIALTLPTNTAVLAGTVTDDGKPNPPGALSFSWARVSGPSEVTLSTPNSVTTSAVFPVAGTYVLRLTANDSVLSGSDDVSVVVNPAPAAPPVIARLALVNADTDQSIVGYDPLQPNTSINLAMLPSRNISIRAYTTPDTVGSVLFTVNGVQQPIENSAPYVIAGDVSGNISPWAVPLGVNTITVTAFSAAAGGGLSSAPSQVVLTVTDVANKPPVVNAGADRVLFWPNASLALAGTATDDGMPKPMTYSWSKVSGQGTVTFSAPTSLNTTATFSSTGMYVLRLTVSDGALTTTDDVEVKVRLAPPGQLKVR